jgi:hypothetical protein
MKYYVLTNIGQYEPSITECETIEEAKKEYREKLSYCSDVRIARDLQVTIEVIDDVEVEIRK